MIYANMFTNQNQQFQTWGQAGTVLPGRGCQDTGWVGGDPTQEHGPKRPKRVLNPAPQGRAPPGFGLGTLLG